MSSKFSHGITCFFFLATIFAIKAKADDHHQDHSDHSDHIDLDVKKFGAKGDGKTDVTAVRTTLIYEIENHSYFLSK